MISFQAARRLTGLTQQELALALGVTQPAVAAYESGARRPTGQAEQWWRAVDTIRDLPSRSYGNHRGRPIELPASRWRPAIRHDATVVLPARLDWSPRRDPQRQLADTDDRASTYAQVIEEGSPVDIAIWVDPDALAELWPDLPIARHLVHPVTTMLADIGG